MVFLKYYKLFWKSIVLSFTIAGTFSENNIKILLPIVEKQHNSNIVAVELFYLPMCCIYMFGLLHQRQNVIF